MGEPGGHRASPYPARTWAEYGRPAEAVWKGWLNDDQPYLVGGWVKLSEFGRDQRTGDYLVLADFPGGEQIRFTADTPVRLHVPTRAELARG
jgi:hypothetical protein